MARIYLASSWRNPHQPKILGLLREWGHAVYDFRYDSRNDWRAKGPMEPPATAFSWSEMDADWQNWNPVKYREALQTSPRAAQGYIGDLRGMEWADTCVLLLPCGNSAHIEAGYMKGRGKRLVIYWDDNERVTRSGPQGFLPNGDPVPEKEWKFEPDLMYLLADNLVISEPELRDCLQHGEFVVRVHK